MNRKRIIILTLVVLVAAAITIFALASVSAKRKAESAYCGNCMVAICIAARTWASEHDGHFPTNFLVMSNELNSPKILVCPGDHSRQAAANWASFTPEQCSYEIVARNLKEGGTNGVFLRCKIHGHIGYTDGTVFDGVSRRSKL
jgi:hypothetical protein